MRNEEKKKSASSFHFNVFDVVLILLAVLCVVGVWQRGNLQKLFENSEAMESYTVTFEVKKLRSTTTDLLEQDTAFYLEDNGERVSLGKLVMQASARPAIEYLMNENGEWVEAYYPEDSSERLQDVTGTLLCRGIDHNGSFLLEGKTHLAVNQTLLVHTEKADLYIRITGIERAA